MGAHPIILAWRTPLTEKSSLMLCLKHPRWQLRPQVLGFSGQVTVPFFSSVFQKLKMILIRQKKVIQSSYQSCCCILNSNKFPLCSYSNKSPLCVYSSEVFITFPSRSCPHPLQHCMIMVIQCLCFNMSFFFFYQIARSRKAGISYFVLCTLSPLLIHAYHPHTSLHIFLQTKLMSKW